MNTLCDHFDPYFERWYADVYRLCLVLTLHPAHAQQLLFDAALRLGAAKDPHIGEEAARDLFFESAVRLCEDYYLRRMRKTPRREPGMPNCRRSPRPMPPQCSRRDWPRTASRSMAK